MAPATSAGILLFRFDRNGTSVGAPRVQVLLGHPGGPFWQRKDTHAWTIPKGGYSPGEDPLAAACREFTEELGQAAPAGPFMPLGTVRQASGKTVTAWAVNADFDPATAVSNTVEIEWPPRSGRRIEVPEIDRVAWFDLTEAREKVIGGQIPLLDRLAELLL